MKFLFLYLALLLSTLLPAQETTRVYLSGKDAAAPVDWEFRVTDGRRKNEWTTIPVPAHWELHGFGTYNYGLDWTDTTKLLGKEHGQYRHRFRVPTAWRGMRINLVFDGAMTDTRAKVNGRSAGPVHQGSFYRFRYDVTELLDYGSDNLLEVDVAKYSDNASVNAAERESDFWIFGGLFRPVFLEVQPPIHITELRTDPRHDGSLRVEAILNQPSPGARLSVSLRDADGVVVGSPFNAAADNPDTLRLTGTFAGVAPWNPESPTLYTLTTTLTNADGAPLHIREDRIGFRTVELRPQDGLYVNDKKVILKGVNRHSFHPESGRALSEATHLEDIGLMRGMNMNAVRMSHYPPDERFLELTDSLGLFVLDELAGWQDGYDTIVGPDLVRETVQRDANHPSVIIWDHGNEGGWTFDNERWFHVYDLQQRPVIYPWLLRNGMNAFHYPTFEYGTNRFVYGSDVFMPTELLHGLYDGGHGAGLRTFWNAYTGHPAFAGGFLWVLRDEAVRRTDLPGTVYDSDGNHAPDGIVGPHGEKEGSYFTIREVWSPVQLKPVAVNPRFDGKLLVENRYLYTDLNATTFHWATLSADGLAPEANVLARGRLNGPDVPPGETRTLQLPVAGKLDGATQLQLTAIGARGDTIHTWSWAVQRPVTVTSKLLADVSATSAVTLEEFSDALHVAAGRVRLRFAKATGRLMAVESDGRPSSLRNGPRLVGLPEQEVQDVDWSINAGGVFELSVHFRTGDNYFRWEVHPTGLVKLHVRPIGGTRQVKDFLGVTFDYDESLVNGVTWLGKGPYRTWRNRPEGNTFGVWSKAYNNTVTGESFNELIYPEFKGYHEELYWLHLDTDEGPLTVLSETDRLYFHLFTPEKPRHGNERTHPAFPDGDLSFLQAIPPIGTKFKDAAALGYRSQPLENRWHSGEEGNAVVLWFDFGGILR